MKAFLALAAGSVAWRSARAAAGSVLERSRRPARCGQSALENVKRGPV
jgi:hypothetical protein